MNKVVPMRDQSKKLPMLSSCHQIHLLLAILLKFTQSWSTLLALDNHQNWLDLHLLHLVNLHLVNLHLDILGNLGPHSNILEPLVLTH